MSYDYVIIGGGPSGLTCSFLLGKIGKRVLLVDSNDSLGGCHRVSRVPMFSGDSGLWAKHGPRIYSSAYQNTRNVLKMMGYKWDDLFTPYNFAISQIGGQTIKSLKIRELTWLTVEFISLMVSVNHGKNISMLKYMTDHSFSNESMDYIDRLCRLTDGAGSDRYSLYEFLSLANEQGLQGLYQPKFPNDIGLFAKWQKAIDDTGNVTIWLNSKVKSVSENSVTIIKDSQDVSIAAATIILAIPPVNLLEILQESPIADAWGNIDEWVKQTDYISDIPIVFHWDSVIDIPKIYGFPRSEWGVAFVNMTDYMNFTDDRSKTVFSCLITRQNMKSSITGKTANETMVVDDLIGEVFRQLNENFKGALPSVSYSLLYPGVSYVNGKWVDSTTAYVAAANTGVIEFAGKYKGIYNVGTHNGKSSYSFTSMESAVSNALCLLHKLEPSLKRKIPLERTLTIRDILIWVITVGLIILGILLLKHYVVAYQ